MAQRLQMHLEMKRKGQGSRLSDSQRLEILNKKARYNPPSNRALGREYGVSEKTIRDTVNRGNEIRRRCAAVPKHVQERTQRVASAEYPELESMVYQWIDASRQAKLEIPPNLVITKALKLASDNNFEGFKGTWGWYRRFKTRYGLGSMLLHGEGAEVDKNDPEILRQLEELD